MKKTKVIILGGGFGGVYTALRLDKTLARRASKGGRDGRELVDEKARHYSFALEPTFRHLPIGRHTSFVPSSATLSAEKSVTVLIFSLYKRFPEIDLVRYAACYYQCITRRIGEDQYQMSTNLEAKRHPLASRVEEQTTRQRKVIRTTLGELIVAVTDEVVPFIRDPSGLYLVVSYVLNDLLAHHHLRVHKQSRRKYASCLAKTLH
ncbi:MAG TPA: hypothetical protein VGR01_12365 [Burkholderiales bacterium]|jgi:hypothetical protein|nr:hypothetical protein [Burkholderiales bacterium]